MRKLQVLLLMWLFQTGHILSGQQNEATIFFEEKEFNFGTIRESEGIVTHAFTFTNRGDLPLIINNVTSTCGCTTQDWPRDPVIPGRTGTIKVTYDPRDRPGAFTRSVIISSNAETPVVNLAVRGVVIPVDLINEVYQYQIGDLRLETIYASFGEIYMGDTAIRLVKIYNGSKDLQIKLDFPNLPAHIAIRTDPEILQPLQEGVMKVEYLTPVLSDWDYVVDRLDVRINGTIPDGGRFNITANIREDFSTLTSQDLASAPLVSFSQTSHDFGNISLSQMVSYDFRLTNLGKNDLLIRKVSASCGCTAVQPESKVVGPGNSIGITAVFDPKGQGIGPQKKAITVITNDPKHSKTILWIEAYVGEDGEGMSNLGD